MNKATTILKGLKAAGVDDEAALRIVKGQVDAGEAFDDLGSDINVDELDQAVDMMKASLEGEYTPDNSGEPVAKGGDFDPLFDQVDTDITDVLMTLTTADASVTKALNEMSYESRANHEVVTKGMVAMATMLKDLGGVFKAQARQIEEIQQRQDEIAKGIGRPLPPRSILTGATPIPAPFEPVAKGGAAPGDGAAPQGVTVGDVMKAATDEFNDIVKGGPVEDVQKKQRLNQLGNAIGKLESGGADPAAIQAQFNIKAAS